MLTDKEIQEIRNRAKLNDHRQIDPMAFAREVERAVLAKASEHKPYGYVYDGQLLCNDGDFQDYFDGVEYDKESMVKLYVHPLPAQAIPEGWHLVPIEPADEMLAAARDWSVGKYGIGIGNDAAIGCYVAMLSASPKP